MKKRYTGYYYVDSYPLIEKYGYITPYLRSLGIKRDDRIYVTPDETTNNTLYLMNQRGNNDYGFSFPTRKEKIEFLLPKGLKYILIGDSSAYEEGMAPYLSNKIGEFSGVNIYKIPDEFLAK